MLRRFALASFAMFLVGASQPPPPRGPDAQAQQHHVSAKPQGATQSAQNQPLSAVIIEAAQDHQPNSDKTSEKGGGDSSKSWWAAPEWWLVGFTGVLTIATIALGVFTYLLWRETRRAVVDTAGGLEIANKTYISAHRPRLIVRDILGLLPPAQNLTKGRIFVSIFASICNNGDTDARIVQSTIMFDLLKTPGPMITPKSDGEQDIDVPGWIKPGEHHTFTITSLRHSWNSETAASYDTDEQGFFFCGHIIYEDRLGTRRHTAFRRRYSPIGQRFYKIYENDNDHEYAD